MKKLLYVTVAVMVGSLAGPGFEVAADDSTDGRDLPVSDTLVSEAPAQPREACEHCGDACETCTPTVGWSVTGDWIMMKRSTAAPGLMYNNGPTDPPVDVKDMLFNYEPGFQISLVRQGPCNDLELRYLNTTSWVSRKTADLHDPYTTISFPDAQRGEVDVPITGPAYASDYTRLDSFEINLLPHTCRWFTPILGFRWIQLQDEYVGSATTIPGTPWNSSPVNARSLTCNELFGAQIGGVGRIYDRCCRFHLDVFLKAGIYGNDALRQADGTVGTVLSGSYHVDRANVAFVGEAGIIAAYDLTCHLSVRGGYQVMWMDGIALAPDQGPNINNFISAIDHNSLLIDGFFAGLEFRR